MQIKGIDCPSCGAPILIDEGSSKARCEYCGRDVLLESQMIQNIGNKVANTFQEVETQTQGEIRRLQLSQELSILQMQLANLRAEKRGLERTGGRQITGQIRQIQEEEKALLNQIAAIQNVLNPPKPSDNSGKVQVLSSKRTRSKSGIGRFVVKFLAWAFLGAMLAMIPVFSWGISVPTAEQKNWLDHYMSWIMIGSLLLSAIILNIGGIRSLFSVSKQQVKEDGRSCYKQGLSLMNSGQFDDAKMEFMKVIQNSSPESRWYTSAQTRLMEMKIQGK